MPTAGHAGLCPSPCLPASYQSRNRLINQWHKSTPQSLNDPLQLKQSCLFPLPVPCCRYVMHQISRALTLRWALFFLEDCFSPYTALSIFPMLLPLLVSPAVLTCYMELQIMNYISGVLRFLLITYVSESENPFRSYRAQLELRKPRFQNPVLKR